MEGTILMSLVYFRSIIMAPLILSVLMWVMVEFLGALHILYMMSMFQAIREIVKTAALVFWVILYDYL